MKKIVFFALLNVLLSLSVSAQNVGIGTSTPAYKLDVNGTVHSTGTLTVSDDVNASGDVNAAGDVTAHGGGVLYNTVSSSGVPVGTNLKVYYRTAAFNVTNLAAHTVSAEGTVGIAGGFTAPPMVFVGDITVNGGTAGPLYQLQMITYGSTTGSFKIRLLNTSDFPITQNITWNIMCIGR